MNNTLKDDEALEAYLTQKALEEASLHVNETAPAMQGAALEELVGQFREVDDLIGECLLFIPSKCLNH